MATPPPEPASSGSASGNTDLVLELPSDVQTIEHVVQFVMDHCASCAARGRELRFNFRVGLTEALSNAMLYGNALDPEKRVRIEVVMDESRITARVIDEGNGFDPDQVPDPTCPDNLEKPGGRGIFLMRKLLDEVHFNDRGNCVTLVLRRSPGTEAGGGARA